jgi:hypothetical protein
LVLNVAVRPNRNEIQGGVPMNNLKPERYILLSALPDELQMRVKTAIQAIMAGM